MNTKNLTTLLTFLGVILIVAFVVLLIVLDKDPSTYIGSLVTIVGLVSGLGLVGNKLDKVSKNVNGNQTRLLNENAELRRQLGLPTTGSNPTVPDNGFVPSEPLMSEETISRIQRDKDALPSHD